jgi:hypothetical protein
MAQVLTRSPAIRHGENTIDWHAQRPAADPHGLNPGTDRSGPQPGTDRSGSQPGADPAAPQPGADPSALKPGDGPSALKPSADPSGPTLADVVARAWEVLGAELPACCPVCGGELIPHPHTAGGRCASCGSTLT